MIDYIIGGVIIILAVYVIVRQAKRSIKGQSGCGHGCCSCGGQCDGNKINK